MAQSWPHIEVVVLDNHSTDHTAAVMARLMAEDPRVRHVRHERNIGMLANFNAIPALVDGDYFAMLTDDDFYEPEFLITALRCFEADPDVALVACNAPTLIRGVAKGSQLDYWREGKYPAGGSSVFKCLLGHYPIITNCLFKASLEDMFHFEQGLGNTGDGYILTAACASHTIYISRYVSGYWNNDGDNASSLQAFDPVLITDIALVEYSLYRALAGKRRFPRHWLVVAWFKRCLSILVAADKMDFAQLRAKSRLGSEFGPVARSCLGGLSRIHLIRMFMSMLSFFRRAARGRVARDSDRFGH